MNPPLDNLEDYNGPRPECPHCKEPLRLLRSERYRYPSGRLRLYWQCAKCPTSNVGAHPDGQPFGFPAPDQETKLARIEAHESASALMKLRSWNNGGFYMWLREKMNLSEDACHIAKFGIADCLKVCELCAEEISEAYTERADNEKW